MVGINLDIFMVNSRESQEDAQEDWGLMQRIVKTRLGEPLTDVKIGHDRCYALD